MTQLYSMPCYTMYNIQFTCITNNMYLVCNILEGGGYVAARTYTQFLFLLYLLLVTR